MHAASLCKAELQTQRERRRRRRRKRRRRREGQRKMTRSYCSVHATWMNSKMVSGTEQKIRERERDRERMCQINVYLGM